MFERVRKTLLTSMLVLLAAVITLTGCGKNGSCERKEESSERNCHHFTKEEKSHHHVKNQVKKEKTSKKKKCSKCNRNHCICLEQHEDDEMMEHHSK